MSESGTKQTWRDVRLDPKAALDTLDYPVLDAAVFHVQPPSEAR